MSQPNPIATFLLEAEDLLGQIDDLVLDLGGHQPDPETIHHLFRAFHTIKGSGAMFGFDAMAGFTHHVETALDRVREGTLEATGELLELVLASADHIRRLLEAAQAGKAADTGSGDEIAAKFSALVNGAAAAGQPAAQPAERGNEARGAARAWKIRFAPAREVFASGTNPRAILDELRAMGEATVRGVLEELPPLDQIQPDHCYARWEIALKTDRSENEIRDVFIFVEDVSTISIEACEPAGTAEAAAAEDVKPAPQKAISRESSIRVASDKLDRLVNLVGELVISQSRLSQSAAHLDAPELSAPVEEIERLVAELRDSVLGIRMMPIGTTFTRFKRLVHDLSAELGKEVDLVTEGASTELDKTVLDQLGDPLVHLIRNSLDHGIGSAEERARAGKPRRGTITLKAVHAGSNVVVSISDDGRGLDAAAIRAKALEKRLIAPDAQLSEKEIYGLIMQPGFSTAREVTKVSGRGVGMDVVKRQIDSLRGTVSIESRAGKGTTISLTLPLTLAIIEGLLTEVGGEQYIIPMPVVLENVELRRSDRLKNNGRNVIAVRGELISYIPLRETFNVAGDQPEISRIVIVKHGEQRVGLLVDRVIGSHQTVIQSLGAFYRNIDVVSGSTIMGDGRVALILDLGGLVKYASGAAAEGPGPRMIPQTENPEQYAYRG